MTVSGSVRVRPAAVAGMFYPASAAALTADVDAMLASARRRHPEAIGNGTDAPDADGVPPPCVVVPHAGIVYSGSVAASVYAQLERWRGAVRQVVIVAPAHRVAVRGLATVSVDALATPLGQVPVAADLRAEVLTHPGVQVNDAAHADEHAVEVQLPFLQRALGTVEVLPLVVGLADPEVVAGVLEPLWGRPGVLVVISTDLSHYHDESTARRLDARTAAAVVAGAPERIDHDDACGATALRAALVVARHRGEHATLVEQATSADAGGPRGRVVGYAGFVIR